MVLMLERGLSFDSLTLERAIDMVRADESPSEVLTTEVLRTARNKPVRPRSAGQKRYVEAVADGIVTFAIGPAGTGKSWLAVAMAIRAMKADLVDRIVLTRPLVEAGERVGFLPGDLMAKVDPYLRPLYDALFDMLDAEHAQRLLDRGQVEVAPLAFMRGRTLNNSFIILDEAQNTTPEQMKMFLTRVGFGSRVVVTGDISQVDVPDGRSGLEGLESMLTGINGLSFVRLGARDVVRHRIVQDIVEAYDRADSRSADRPSND
jgi:phosphate starvation-inducible PhoH-like protein